MQKDCEKLFKTLQAPEPSAQLFGKIMRRINREERLSARRNAISAAIFFIFSVFALIPAFNVFEAGFSQSGFTAILSLVFSDASVVFNYWQNFVFALLESLPVINMIIFLITIFVFLQSLKYLYGDFKIIFKSLGRAVARSG